MAATPSTLPEPVLASPGRVRVEPSRKRVRAFFSGVPVVDTIRPLLVWEVPFYPAYYLPLADVRDGVLEPSAHRDHSPSRGDAVFFHLRVGDRAARDAAWRYSESPIEVLRDHIRFDWDAIDAWFEEDEQIYTHPRSPHTRVDILPSSRHVRVVVNGEQIADSYQPRILFETGLPPRYYLPLTDLRLDRLRPSAKTTHCPYKGTATYWSVESAGELVEDLVWTYRTPLPESERIAGLACFYDERVDLYVDGVLQERPQTPFS